MKERILAFIFLFLFRYVKCSVSSCNVRSGTCNYNKGYAEENSIYQLDISTATGDASQYEAIKNIDNEVTLEFLTPLNASQVQVVLQGEQKTYITFSQAAVGQTSFPRLWTTKEIAPAKPTSKKYPESLVISIFEGPTIVYETDAGDIVFQKSGQSVTFKKANVKNYYDEAKGVAARSRMLATLAMNKEYTFVENTYKAQGKVIPLYETITFPIKLSVVSSSKTTLVLSVEAFSVVEYGYKWNSESDLSYVNSYDVKSIQTSVKEITNVLKKIKDVFSGAISIKVQYDESITVTSVRGYSMQFRSSKANKKIVVSGQTFTVEVYEPGYMEITVRSDSEKIKYKTLYCNCSSHHIYSVTTEGTNRLNPSFDYDLNNARSIHYNTQGKYITVGDAETGTNYKIDTIIYHESKPIYLEYAPKSYITNGEARDIFQGKPETYAKIHVHIYELKPGLRYIVYKILNIFYGAVSYQVTDGWVTENIPIAGNRPIIAVEASIGRAEASLKDLISNVQQISINEAGNFIQFIKDYGSTRMGFNTVKGSTEYLDPSPEVNKKDHDDYIDKELKNTPISVTFNQEKNQIKLGIRTFSSEIIYNVKKLEANRNIELLSTEKNGYAFTNSAGNNAQQQAFKILATASSISFVYSSDNSHIQAVTINAGKKYIEIKLAEPLQLGGQNTHPHKYQTYQYKLIPNTYMVNFRYADIYANSIKTDVYVDVYKKNTNQIQVTLNMENKYVYNFDYNEHGYITSKTFTKSKGSGLKGTGEIEQRVHQIIQDTDQLSFENDGQLQFIGTGAKNRFVFRSPYTYNSVIVTSNAYPTIMSTNELIDGEVEPSGNCYIQDNQIDTLNIVCIHIGARMTAKIVYDHYGEVMKSINIEKDNYYDEQILIDSLRSVGSISHGTNELTLSGGLYYIVLKIYWNRKCNELIGLESCHPVLVRVRNYDPKRQTSKRLLQAGVIEDIKNLDAASYKNIVPTDIYTGPKNDVNIVIHEQSEDLTENIHSKQ